MTLTSGSIMHLHLVSDSTGGTVHGVSKACLAQFSSVKRVEHFWNLIRDEAQLGKVLKGISKNPGPVFLTIVDEISVSKIKKHCRMLDVPTFSILQPFIQEIGVYVGQKSQAKPGLQHVLDDAYFERMDAMDYALYHDDGQKTGRSLSEADVILIGVSRTSKTPTSIYLANHGVKTANIPLIPEIGLPSSLQDLETKPLFIALTESPSRLVEIRRTRLKQLGEERSTDYYNLEKVKKEVADARKIYSSNGWPIIDVTQRSVEETAAEILFLLRRHKAKNKVKY